MSQSIKLNQIQVLNAEKPGSALAKTLIISSIIVLVLIGLFYFWLDKLSNQHAEENYAAAKDFSTAGDYENAVIKLNDALKFKEKPIYYYSKYNILCTQEKYYEAGLNIEKAFEQEPKNAAYAYEAGTYYLGPGQDGQKGLSYLKKAMELDPKNSDYQLAYGTSLGNFSQFDESIRILEKLLKDDPNYYSVWNDLASIYSLNKNPKKSLELREKATRQFPNDAYHWFWLANSYDLQNKKKQAIDAYQKSIELQPETGIQASYRIAILTGNKVPEKYREIVEDSIPVQYFGSHAFIHAIINGHPGKFLLDTGATDSVLYQSFLDKYSLLPDSDGPTVQYETVAGLVSAPVYYANLKIGRFDMENSRIAIIDPPSHNDDSDGIIGMSVLKNFDIKMDNLRQTLVFSRK